MQKLNQLCLEAIKLAAGEEWMEGAGAWRFVRVHSGAAYWLSDGNNRPLSEGEMLIVPPHAEGLVRASQIGDVLLHGFKFSPEMLCGFFTLAERDFLETRGRNAGDVQFLPSTHPLAQQFAAIIPAMRDDHPLPLRVTALGLVAAVFEGEMASHRPPRVRGSTAQDRFEKMIVQMPETEIINHTPEELARLCGCSPRHFNRLFREQFGLPARARQTELRLLKSRQLLATSDDKIINIAVASGYRNLSLFNSLFKKRFGQTPSQWRKNSAKPPAKLRRLSGLAVLVFMFLMAPLLRAEPAGSASTAPAAPAAAPAGAKPAPLTFKVTGYKLEGNTLLPPDIYEPIFSRYTGDAVTFDIIRLCLADLQLAYRHRGFMTVAVSLPQQKLTDGIVRVKVTEGRLVAVIVKGNKHFQTDNILRALPSARTNTLLNSLVFQEELDRANANGDRQVYPVISPGPTPGTTVLELRVKDRLPFHMHMELNNYYTPGTPDLRMNLSAVYNNLWQMDHQFGLQYSFSPGSLKSRDGVLPDNGDAPPYVAPFDRPQIVDYSTFYRMPLEPLNGYPQQYTVSDFGYDEVTHRFRPPPLTGAAELIFFASRSYSDTGSTVSKRFNSDTNGIIPPTGGLVVNTVDYNRTLSPNEDIGFRLTKPLPPLGSFNSTVSAGMDFKNYRALIIQSSVAQGTLYIPAQGATGPPWTSPNGTPSPPQYTSNYIYNAVQYLPISLDWSGSLGDKFGSTMFDFGQSFNFTGWLGNKQNFQTVAGTTNTDGNYYVATVSLTRDQKLWHDWGVKLHADGQYANQPLISNEQFGLGGQSGVRGYIDGDQYGDCGWRVQFEPHTPYMDLGLVDGDTPMLTRFYTFLDYGQTISQNPAAAPGTVSLLGTGCGVDTSIGQHFDFRLMFGVPFIGVPHASESSTVHVAFSLAAQL